MLNYYQVMILVIIVHFVINGDTLINNHYGSDLPVGKSFRMFVIGITQLFLIDGLWGYFYIHKMGTPLYIASYFYFMMVAVSFVLWIRIVYARFNQVNFYLKFIYYSAMLYLLFMIGVLIVNIFHPIIFSVDLQGNYHIYIFRSVVIIVQSALFIIASVYFVFLFKVESKEMSLIILARLFTGMIMAVALLLHETIVQVPYYSIGCLLAACTHYKFIVEKYKDDHYQEIEQILKNEQVLKKQIGDIEHMANTDSLTGVKSSRAYKEAISKIDESISKGELQEFGVIVFDVNNLKKTNDKYGHKMGDLLLKVAANTIISYFTEENLYRIGGDEFVVLLTGEQYENRKMLLANFETEIERNVKDEGVIIASGIAIYSPSKDMCFRTIFERADLRMYDCKSVLKSMEQSYR